MFPLRFVLAKIWITPTLYNSMSGMRAIITSGWWWSSAQVSSEMKFVCCFKHLLLPKVRKYTTYWIIILSTYNYSFFSPFCYFSTTLIGGSLDTVIVQDGYLLEDVVRSFGWNLVKGLKYIHEMGIILSDLTPTKVCFNFIKH